MAAAREKSPTFMNRSTLRGSSSAVAAMLCSSPHARTDRRDRGGTPGSGERLPALSRIPNASGALGVLNTSGAVDTKGTRSSKPLGPNGRAVRHVSPARDGMSLSVDAIREQWRATGGRDPLLRGDRRLELSEPSAGRGRIAFVAARSRTVPRRPALAAVAADGSRVTPEFTIESCAIRAPCNTDADTACAAQRRRLRLPPPAVAANLKYVAAPSGPFNIKTGDLMDVDPETAHPVGDESDVGCTRADVAHAGACRRHAIICRLARALREDEAGADRGLREARCTRAQRSSRSAGSLVEAGGPQGLGPQALAAGERGLGDNIYAPVFGFFDPWKAWGGSPRARNSARSRESVAPGADVFFLRPIWIRDTVHINTIGLGNPLKRTCATCHNSKLVGMDLAPGYVDLGTTNFPRWTEPSLYQTRRRRSCRCSN
jgi:hypothetical protein